MGIQVTPIKSFAKITELATSGDLYVINNSDLGNKQSRGNVVMDIVGENGASFGVTVLDTWVPQNLANFCEPLLYLKSNTFRELVAKEILVVLDTKNATDILTTPQAIQAVHEKDEARRAYAANLTASTTISAGPEKKININTNNNGLSETVTTEKSAAINHDDNELHRLVANFNANAISDELAVQALFTLRPSLDALKVVGGEIANTSSQFYLKIGDMISEGTTTHVGN